MSNNNVKFQPSKALFIDILTKDINIHDCILDLIDNSIDSYTRSNVTEKRTISLTLNKQGFEIYDNCGGIPYKMLIDDVFRLGVRALTGKYNTIGMYGIGLKRSIFKLGKKIQFETDDGKNYCKLNINVDEWCKDDKKWDLPLKQNDCSKLKTNEKPYTKIKINDLNPEIKEAITDVFINKLKESIEIYYTRFLEDKIDFTLNSVPLMPFDISIKSSDRFLPANHVEKYNDIKIQIICWLELAKEKKSKIEKGKQGWNIFVNDRLILHDDVSNITGWKGEKNSLPKYHQIFNDFRGLVFLSSSDAYKLPINTSKNGLNIENKVYIYVLKKMVETARPLINYLSKKYQPDKNTISEKENQLVDKINKDNEKKIVKIKIEDLNKNQKFVAPKTKKIKMPKTTSISYSKPKETVDKLKKIFKVKSNAEVGIATFDYYIKSEGIDNE